MVAVDRPWQRVGLRLALEDRDAVATLGEEDRQGQADGSAADDDDVGVGHGCRRGWWPQALMRSYRRLSSQSSVMVRAPWPTSTMKPAGLVT